MSACIFAACKCTLGKWFKFCHPRFLQIAAKLRYCSESIFQLRRIRRRCDGACCCCSWIVSLSSISLQDLAKWEKPNDFRWFMTEVHVWVVHIGAKAMRRGVHWGGIYQSFHWWVALLLLLLVLFVEHQWECEWMMLIDWFCRRFWKMKVASDASPFFTDQILIGGTLIEKRQSVNLLSIKRFQVLYKFGVLWGSNISLNACIVWYRAGTRPKFDFNGARYQLCS